MCDTDSMAIVATEHGGLVACNGGTHRDQNDEDSVQMPWHQVKSIADRFGQLNPYDKKSRAGHLESRMLRLRPKRQAASLNMDLRFPRSGTPSSPATTQSSNPASTVWVRTFIRISGVTYRTSARTRKTATQGGMGSRLAVDFAQSSKPRSAIT